MLTTDREEEENQHHPQEDRKKKPSQGGEGMEHHQKGEVNFSLSSFWTVVPSPCRFDPLLLLAVLPSSASFGWCFLPLPSLDGAAVPPFLEKNCKSGCAYNGITDAVTNLLMKVQHVTVSENSDHNSCVSLTRVWTWNYLLSRQT